jgi:hypothetical protein
MRASIKLLIINIFYKAKDFVLFAYKISPTKPTIFSYIPSVIVLNKLKKILPIFILFINLFLCCEAFGAIEITGTPIINFGTIMQNTTYSTITLDITGNITSYSGIYKPGNTSATPTIQYGTSETLGNTFDAIKLYPANATLSLDIPNCEATISNVTANTDTNFIIRGGFSLWSCTNLSTSKSISYSATLNLNGYCEADSDGILYEGFITVPGTSRTCSVDNFSFTSNCSENNCDSGDVTIDNPHTIAVQVTLAQPLEVEETQSMHFGSILARNGGTVVVDPDSGDLTWSGVTIFDSTSGEKGIFKVTGIGGRQVNITIPNNSTTLTRVGGTETMKVTNIKLNTSKITLPDVSFDEASEYFSVGGTLTVGANQASGTYSGTYTVNVSY